jgi:hypothetical protein
VDILAFLSAMGTVVGAAWFLSGKISSLEEKVTYMQKDLTELYLAYLQHSTPARRKRVSK